MTFPDLHATHLDRLLGGIRADHRIDAVLGAGSLIWGGFDIHSDLDLVVVVKEAGYTEVMDQRLAFAESLGDFITGFTGEHVGEPRLLICMYGPPMLHVDLKFVRLGDLDHMVERPVILWARDEAAVTARLNAAHIEWPSHDADWFEARAWLWLHYGATKLQRGELWEAINMLSFFREQVLGNLLCRREGRHQRGLRRIRSEALQATHAGYDAHDISAALKASAMLYLDLRADDPPVRLTPHMPAALLPFFEVAA